MTGRVDDQDPAARRLDVVVPDRHVARREVVVFGDDDGGARRARKDQLVALDPQVGVVPPERGDPGDTLRDDRVPRERNVLGVYALDDASVERIVDELDS